jgi:hypothetical protein
VPGGAKPLGILCWTNLFISARLSSIPFPFATFFPFFILWELASSQSRRSRTKVDSVNNSKEGKYKGKGQEIEDKSSFYSFYSDYLPII